MTRLPSSVFRFLLRSLLLAALAQYLTGTGYSDEAGVPAGVNWISQTPAANNTWVSVVWGGPAGQEKFAAVGSSAVMTSQATAPPPFISATPSIT